MSTSRRLSQLLLASHMGPVLLFALLLLVTGVGAIRSASLAQARSEAERASSESRRRLQEWQRELTVASDLLAEQPTLRFYLQRGQYSKARALVTNFHGTSDIEFIRVQLGERLIAEVGKQPPAFATGLVFDRKHQPWRIVSRTIPGLPSATIVVAEQLGDRLLVRPTSELVNVSLRPLMRSAIGSNPSKNVSFNAYVDALREVSVNGEPDTYDDVGGSATARIVGLRDDDGRLSALLVARVPQAWVTRRIMEWFASFALASALTGVVAFALAVLLASRIARPFAQVARDAERLGRGDLETPVAPPATFLAEPVALASSLEAMRGQVSRLTMTERSQREELDAVLDGVDEGIVGVDAAGRVHYANRQFIELVGLDREEVIGHAVESLLTPIETRESSLPPSTVGLPSLERCTPAGQARPLTVRRLAASNDRQILVVREENAIEAARGMRDRILANLSHEFRTPLSAQIASIELLRDHLRTSADPVAVQLTDAQYRGTMRLSQLVDNLLDSVRIESGEMRLRKQAVNLESVVADAIELMRPLIDQRGQRVVGRLFAGPVLTGDSPRLSSVIVNLLANANKFAPDQTTVWVDMEWSADDVTVWVEDEGPGLPVQGELRDLFAPFRRSPHEEPSERGTGLGLAIVHAIVVAHGGEVKVAAPLQGSGARIGIVLPLETTT